MLERTELSVHLVLWSGKNEGQKETAWPPSKPFYPPDDTAAKID